MTVIKILTSLFDIHLSIAFWLTSNKSTKENDIKTTRILSIICFINVLLIWWH
nr:MAG TPA_asm: hypothetical protein [Caudoviricetes sp.]